MADDDRRFDRSPITLEHASARGRVLRNADNFTRGSQLIGHQFSMFRAGVRVPVLIWLGIFIMIYWIMLTAVMGEHEIQLCSWRLGSTLWAWMDFSPLKPMNIVLHDGSIRRTSMVRQATGGLNPRRSWTLPPRAPKSKSWAGCGTPALCEPAFAP